LSDVSVSSILVRRVFTSSKLSGAFDGADSMFSMEKRRASIGAKSVSGKVSPRIEASIVSRRC